MSEQTGSAERRKSKKNFTSVTRSFETISLRFIGVVSQIEQQKKNLVRVDAQLLPHGICDIIRFTFLS